MAKTSMKMSLMVLLAMTGCAKSDPAGSGVVLSSSELQAQRIEMVSATIAQCANGGTALTTYVDANSNLVRDADETVIATSVVCAGANGTNGSNGSNGSNGADGKDGSNGTDGKDGATGSTGSNGADGKDGANGADGKDGTNGTDGLSPYGIVFAVSPTAPGCKNGGSTISFGLDVNANGKLDEEDKNVQSTEICNGADGKDGVVEADFKCSVKLSTSSVWKEGYIMDVVVKYDGPARTGWKMKFTLPDSQSFANIWNASPSAMQGEITASSFSYNEKLEKGSEIKFGFQVTRSGSEILDTSSFSMNGVACK